MNCKQIMLLLNEYIDNELDQKTHNEITNHLFSCPKCRKKMEDFLLIKNALRSISEPSEEFSDRLTHIFKDTHVSCEENKNKCNLRFLFCIICIAICAIITMSNISASHKNGVEIASSEEECVIVSDNSCVSFNPMRRKSIWRDVVYNTRQ